MASTSKMRFGRPLQGKIRWILIAVVTGFLLGCSEKYVYKHREYADPDDELFGMRAIERAEGSLQQVVG